MRIAVCDDEVKIRELLKEEIQRYSFEQNIDWYLSTFDSGTHLLETNLDLIDVLFLDMDMPGKNGMETAREIRRFNKNMIIIFLTAYSEFVFESFKVEAFRYLIKPLKKQELRETLQAVEQKLCAPEDYFCFYFQNERFSIKYAEILYLEGMQDKIWIHCSDKTYRWRGRMKSADLLLKEKGFFQVHRSYIINMNRIQKYSSTEVFMEGGDKVPISKYRMGAFKEAYIKFWSKVL